MWGIFWLVEELFASQRQICYSKYTVMGYITSKLFEIIVTTQQDILYIQIFVV